MCRPTNAGQLTILSFTGSQLKLEGLRENHWHRAVIETLFNSCPRIEQTFPLIATPTGSMVLLEAFKTAL
jgi:hypothetical protein